MLHWWPKFAVKKFPNFVRDHWSLKKHDPVQRKVLCQWYRVWTIFSVTEFLFNRKLSFKWSWSDHRISTESTWNNTTVRTIFSIQNSIWIRWHVIGWCPIRNIPWTKIDAGTSSITAISIKIMRQGLQVCTVLACQLILYLCIHKRNFTHGIQLYAT